MTYSENVLVLINMKWNQYENVLINNVCCHLKIFCFSCYSKLQSNVFKTWCLKTVILFWSCFYSCVKSPVNMTPLCVKALSLKHLVPELGKLEQLRTIMVWSYQSIVCSFHIMASVWGLQGNSVSHMLARANLWSHWRSHTASPCSALCSHLHALRSWERKQHQSPKIEKKNKNIVVVTV